jgi:hypothetical protein
MCTESAFNRDRVCDRKDRAALSREKSKVKRKPMIRFEERSKFLLRRSSTQDGVGCKAQHHDCNGQIGMPGISHLL